MINIINLFLGNTERYPEKVAISYNDRALSYEEAREQARRLSALLHEMGVRRGDCILVLLDNSIEFSITMLAGAELGAMLAPLSTSLKAQGIRTAMTSTGSKFMIGWHASVRALLEEAESEPLIDRRQVLVIGRAVDGCRNYQETLDYAESDYQLGRGDVPAEQEYILTMTSGSTGAPKPISLSQSTKIERSFAGAKDLYGLGAEEVVLTSSPMYHSLGLRLALLPLLIGATSVILEKFSPAGWLAAVEKDGVTFVIMVSSHLELLLNSKSRAHWPRDIAKELPSVPRKWAVTQEEIEIETADLSSLKTIVSSSALLKPEVKQACIERFGCDFHECYGTSEVGIATNLFPDDCRDNYASVGKALPIVELIILSEERKPLPIGTKGEIACRSKTRFSCYFNNEKATRENLVDGYFCTGDIGYLDAEGFLYLCGRKKDIIIVGGTNVFPEDVEAVLCAAPGVRECAVIGVEDNYFGEAILAVIVANEEGVDARSLRTHCARLLADYQQPMACEIVSDLPKSALGKIMRHKLRDQFKGYDATATLRRFLG